MENPYEKLMDECAYEVIKALSRGTQLRQAMASNFMRTLSYLKNDVGYREPLRKKENDNA